MFMSLAFGVSEIVVLVAGELLEVACRCFSWYFFPGAFLLSSSFLLVVVGTIVSPVVEAISAQPSADDNRLATVPETCAQRSTVQVSASVG